MRKHVKPALPDATIPDPARGRDLPPEGLMVDWTVHWARLAQRGDVIVSDEPPAVEPLAPEPEGGPAPEPTPEPAEPQPEAAPDPTDAPPAPARPGRTRT